MREITAATQMVCGWDEQANIAQAEALKPQARADGADLVLIQELFATPFSAGTSSTNSSPWRGRSTTMR